MNNITATVAAVPFAKAQCRPSLGGHGGPKLPALACRCAPEHLALIQVWHARRGLGTLHADHPVQQWLKRLQFAAFWRMEQPLVELTLYAPHSHRAG